VEAQGLDSLTSSSGEASAAAYAKQKRENYGATIERAERRGGTVFSDFDPERYDAGTFLTPEDANELYGIKGKLNFDKPVPEPVAIELSKLKQEEIKRDYIINRREPGVGGALSVFGASAAAAVQDPVGMAVGFIPIVGQTRYAMMLARAGSTVGRVAVRGAVGVAEGTVGTAVLEPFQYNMMRREQADYTAADSMMNIAFGGVLGGGLHIGAGALGAAIRRGTNFETQEAALRAATQDMNQIGSVVTPARVLEADLLGARTAVGEATTPTGLTVGTRLEVMEADDLITSHDSDFRVNPAFPAELQPRDRAAAPGQTQVAEIAGRLNPRLLGFSEDASTGAPIMGPDRIVESGNGRVLALRRAAIENPTGIQQYREYIKSLGFNIEGLRNPVLVRTRTTELTPELRQRFTREGNVSATLTMSAPERAAADARLMDADLLGKLKPGELDNLGNADFVRTFVGKLAQTEQGGLVGADGKLSREGLERLNAGLLARAFPDAGLLRRLLESTDDNVRAIGNALREVAPDWARMRAMDQSGKLSPGVDITADLVAAVRLIDDARTKRAKVADVMAQTSPAELGGPSELTRDLVRMMFKDDDFLKPRSQADLVRELGDYAEQAMRSTKEDALFGSALKPVTAEDIVARQRARSDAEIAAEAKYEANKVKEPTPEALTAQTKALEIQVLAKVGRALPPEEAGAAPSAAAWREIEPGETLEKGAQVRVNETTGKVEVMAPEKPAAPEAAPGAAPEAAPGAAAPALPASPAAAELAGDIARMQQRIDAAAKAGDPEMIRAQAELRELDEADVEAASLAEASQVAASCLIAGEAL
jgi:hypothetical protein